MFLKHDVQTKITEMLQFSSNLFDIYKLEFIGIYSI